MTATAPSWAIIAGQHVPHEAPRSMWATSASAVASRCSSCSASRPACHSSSRTTSPGCGVRGARRRLRGGAAAGRV